MKIRRVCYDATQPYPQPALFGLGVKHEDGSHTPPEGLTSFEVDIDAFTEGTDEEMYEVTAPDTLVEKSQAAKDAIKAERNKPVLRAYARDKMRGNTGALAPDFGDGDPVSQSAYVLSMAAARLNRRAKGNGNGQPQDDALLDSLEAIQDAFEAILADIDSGVITTTAQIDSDPRWP